jgi:hypothetical protein
MIFVFGSNEAGYHGAGAAKYAFWHHGAKMHQGTGLAGNSYAIPTKDKMIKTLPLKEIKQYVDSFIDYATVYNEESFQVTRIGCGLAGYKDEDIAPLFLGSPSNCQFDNAWKAFLGEEYKYWGTIK